jgi:hypothetical protein
MTVGELPTWVASLEEDDLQLIRRFVLASGSLKDLAAEYEVSYPTIRARVDAVIERLRVLDRNSADDVLEARMRILVAEGELAPRMAKELIRLHKEAKGAKT